MNKTVIAGLIFLMLLVVGGASGCQKGTVGTSGEDCMPGHIQSTCPNGEVRCCLNGWVCYEDAGGNRCAPEGSYSDIGTSDPFAGT